MSTVSTIGFLDVFVRAGLLTVGVVAVGVAFRWAGAGLLRDLWPTARVRPTRSGPVRLPPRADRSPLRHYTVRRRPYDWSQEAE